MRSPRFTPSSLFRTILFVTVLGLGFQVVRLSSAMRAMALRQDINAQNIQTLATFLGAKQPEQAAQETILLP